MKYRQPGRSGLEVSAIVDKVAEFAQTIQKAATKPRLPLLTGVLAKRYGYMK